MVGFGPDPDPGSDLKGQTGSGSDLDPDAVQNLTWIHLLPLSNQLIPFT
jgi:hypothetical protein